ncbi:protein-export chaperone SecB [Xylella fastidiosa]|uniref:Protein-export protein SecB n=2 Tax=Xylella fastidiosa TaxID=2371 RepID=SECB_XYLFA|nr:protein-export chaperone SecB [Xylella fastidiosa]Q9PCH8.2 RecName: Full=Protein-export protein SecB [Xylella fastidiosa 9a5c]ALQ95070.1 preprotein translocase subunit SecB [Xylella fastidiosa]ALQ97015.1 protein-export chaperone SecB [Xylella fastidiosa]ALR02273.1 preprotein translocase subunit SecB [Xylella fastidiosa]ALR04157.1 protein-export chaperone SecB [Xylella fastidiosa]ALR06512.1 protein-export chaperone SecB [Xylella fastidiosa]
MSDEITNGAAKPTEAISGPTFTIEKIYIKDVSFEAPNSPAVFNEAGQPELQLNLNQRVQRLNENAFELVLHVTLTCTAAGKTAYVVEVQQAGVFGLFGLDQHAIGVLLGTQCPNILFPYVRSLVSDLIQIGGFPPFYLQPINFDALYAETLRQRAQNEKEGSQISSHPAGNA